MTLLEQHKAQTIAAGIINRFRDKANWQRPRTALDETVESLPKLEVRS
jgi:hypothetical protein